MGYLVCSVLEKGEKIEFLSTQWLVLRVVEPALASYIVYAMPQLQASATEFF